MSTRVEARIREVGSRRNRSFTLPGSTSTENFHEEDPAETASRPAVVFAPRGSLQSFPNNGAFKGPGGEVADLAANGDIENSLTSLQWEVSEPLAAATYAGKMEGRSDARLIYLSSRLCRYMVLLWIRCNGKRLNASYYGT
jgi:hypothetical protein